MANTTVPTFTLRMSIEERINWQAEAKAKKVNLSTWIRLTLNDSVQVKRHPPKHQRLLEAGPDPDPVDVPR